MATVCTETRPAILPARDHIFLKDTVVDVRSSQKNQLNVTAITTDDTYVSYSIVVSGKDSSFAV